jgi:hypothetical protein
MSDNFFFFFFWRFGREIIIFTKDLRDKSPSLIHNLERLLLSFIMIIIYKRQWELWPLHGFPAVSGLDGSCDVLRDRDTPEWSANDRTLIDPHHSACVWAFTICECCTIGDGLGWDISDGLLNILRNDQFRWFSLVVIIDESWFPCRYESTQCYAKSPTIVLLWRKTTSARKTAMATIFFTEKKLFSPPYDFSREQIQLISFSGRSCNKIVRESPDTECRIGNDRLLGHTDNSMCDNNVQIQEDFARKSMTRVFLL